MGLFGNLLAGVAAAAVGAMATVNAGTQELRSGARDVIDRVSGDPLMALATARARETMPRFFELVRARLEAAYLVKVVLSDGHHREHVWAEVASYDGDAFVAHLANDPMTPGFKLGDRVEVGYAEISDWMVNDGKVRYGAYTVRAMLTDMPADQADALRRQLRD